VPVGNSNVWVNNLITRWQNSCVGGGGVTGRARHNVAILDTICFCSYSYSSCLHLQISRKSLLCCSCCLPTVTFYIMLCLPLASEAQVRFLASLCECMVYKAALGHFFSLSTCFFFPLSVLFHLCPLLLPSLN